MYLSKNYIKSIGDLKLIISKHIYNIISVFENFPKIINLSKEKLSQMYEETHNLYEITEIEHFPVSSKNHIYTNIFQNSGSHFLPYQLSISTNLR